MVAVTPDVVTTAGVAVEEMLHANIVMDNNERRYMIRFINHLQIQFMGKAQFIRSSHGHKPANISLSNFPVPPVYELYMSSWIAALTHPALKVTHGRLH
jgi:hypothetical protein